MPELKRALVESLAAHWNALDAHVKEKFEAAAVLARIWTPRVVAADQPSERIAGKDVELRLLESDEVTFELGKHDVQDDLHGLLTRAAESLAAAEDKRGIEALQPGGAASESSYEEAEAKLRESRINDRLAVLVSPRERARLSAEDKNHQSRLQYLEGLLDVDPPHFQVTRALTGATQAQQSQAGSVVGLVTSKDPAPLVIVRAGSPQVRVEKVDGNSIKLKIVLGHAVARTLTANVVAVLQKP